MSKTNYDGMQFRINFISNNGIFLVSTEWTEDRDAIVHLADKVNQHRDIRASLETKGSGYVDVPRNVPHIQNRA